MCWSRYNDEERLHEAKESIVRPKTMESESIACLMEICMSVEISVLVDSNSSLSSFKEEERGLPYQH